MHQGTVSRVELVPVDLIDVVNPRVRNHKIFHEIVSNISEIGLKRPITVAKKLDGDKARYDLICGQGRLEAYRALGQAEIPALVVDAKPDECLVMSLVENLARRQHRYLDLLQDIGGLKHRGYSEPEIARKTGLSVAYVQGIIRLLEQGEHRLLRAVESGQIPLSVAVTIADTPDGEVQEALRTAYENKELRGKRLLTAKRILEQRRRRGKGFRNGTSNGERSLSSAALLRAYQQEADRKRILVQKADTTRNRLMFAIEALKTLFADESFVTLLRAEGLDTMPRNLAERLHTVRPT